MAAQYDSPDWTKIVTTVASTGAVTDAPDWQRIVVGPGGTPVGGGSLTATRTNFGSINSFTLSASSGGLFQTATVTDAGLYVAAVSLLLQDTSGSLNAVQCTVEPGAGGTAGLITTAVTYLPANGYGGVYAVGMFNLPANSEVRFAAYVAGATTLGGSFGASALGITSQYTVTLLST